MNVVLGSKRSPIHYGDIEMAVYIVGISGISFGAAFVLAVFVEFPFGNLEMAFFRLFGVGTRESTRADTEAKSNTALVRSEAIVDSYSTNNNSKPHKTNNA